MKKLLFAVMLVLLLLVTASCTKANITSPAQLNKQEIKVGVSQGSAAEAAVMSELPEATIIYYTDNLLGYTAVAQGKLDAYVHDLVQMQLTIDNGLTGVHLLPEVMDETVKIAVGISDVSKISDLTEKTNRFIAEVKADGTLDDMYRRWVLEGNGVMPEIPTPDNPKIHLTVGTTGNVPPYSYYEGSGLTGYDIELAYRFAAWLGADVSFQIYDFDGIIPAAKSGKVDVIMSNLQYLPERSKELPFSDILYEEKLGIMVRGDAPAIGDVSSVSDGIDMDIAPAYAAYNGKRVAVQTGTISGEVALSVIPDLEVNYFNTQTDCLAALRAGKVDAWCSDEPMVRFLMIDNPDLTMYGEKLDESSLAAVFAKTAKGQELCDEYNTFLEEIWADGTMAEIDDIWFGTDDGKRTVLDYEALSDTNGTLRMAVDASILPFAYVKDNRVVGYDVDIAARFCQARGYRLEVVPMDFAGILPAVQSDKCDFAACCITVTEERAESVLFSSPNYHSGTVMAVLKAEEPAAAVSVANHTQQTENFWEGLSSSFNKTFLRENRWKLFLEGVGTTLLITVLSILFGTLLGFLVFMLCRNGNPVANSITQFCTWLVTGTPMVVLLMILYYIIFGSVTISGVSVAVIGFTLTFGAAVYGLLKMGVGTIDRGQYEAAYALGHSNRHAFFKIILPQAIPHVMPAWQGEIVGLIKATAIVGYIAVQDLTKMGDIVRSRTYEAFFPLIAITVIYFVLEGLFSFVVSRIKISIDPKKRSRERILKGVDIHD